jgi:hypothetical protein
MNFVLIAGRWRIDGMNATYLGSGEREDPVGICLVPTRFRSGLLVVEATIKDSKGVARVVVGYNAATGSYDAIGIGGSGSAYMINEFVPGRGWRAIRTVGAESQLRTGLPYCQGVEVAGQHVSLSVDGVRVLAAALPAPLQGIRWARRWGSRSGKRGIEGLLARYLEDIRRGTGSLPAPPH